VIVGSVKRLMYVADEMEDEFQGDNPFLRRGFWAREFVHEFGDFIDDAGVRSAAGCRFPCGQSRMAVAGLVKVPPAPPAVWTW
jgi:hypothetical protein